MNPTQIKSRLLDAQDDIGHVENLLDLIEMASSSLGRKQGDAISEACSVAKSSLSIAIERLKELVTDQRS